MLSRVAILVCLAHTVAADSIDGAGRLEFRGAENNGTCSAVLIAPNIIATAAHCSGAAEDDILFRPTDLRGGRLFPIEEIVRHPFYDRENARVEWKFRFDIAVGRLSEPVPAERAKPIPLGSEARIGETVYIVSWPGTSDRLLQRACPVIEGLPGLVTLGCAVQGGESGAPVLRKGVDGYELVAIISSKTRLLDQSVAQASDVHLRIPPLIRELDTP